jgi:hypothetical protein
MLSALRKQLVDILPPIQHPHDLGDIIHDSIENDMRSCGKGSETRTQLVSRPPRKWIIFDGGNDVIDFAKDFLCGVPAGNTRVVIPNLVEIDQRLRRQMAAPRRPAILPGLLPDELFHAECRALSRVKRAGALVEFLAQPPELLDV